MANKAFVQVKEAEARAQAIVLCAREEAVRIITRAEEEAAQALAQAKESCTAELALKKQQAQAAAQEASEAFAQETAHMCAALLKELTARKAQAIDTVMEGVVSL